MLCCFLCGKTGIVREFTAETLLKCRKTLAFRRKRNLKYKEILLARNLQQKGYHIPCYNKFIMLKKIYRKEFESMFSNGQEPPIDEIPEPAPPITAITRKNKPSTSNTTGLEAPKLIEGPVIEPVDACDVVLEERDTPYVMYQMDEPSYVNPDISKGVILKSILTRKIPIKKDMAGDSMAFNSGMVQYEGFNQTEKKKVTKEKIGAKVGNTIALDGVCLFCNKEQRIIGTQVELPEELSKVNMYKKVIAFAEAMEDNDLLEKIKYTKTFFVHPLCRIEYRNRHQKITKKNCDDEDWLVFKNLQTEAFEALCAFIDDKIVDKNKSYLLCDLFERYKALLSEFQNTTHPFDIESYCIQNLQEKIVNRYYGIIEVTTCKQLKRKVVYKSESGMNFDNAVAENEDYKYDKLAFELRNVVKSMKRTAESRSDTELPEKLFRFVNSLIQGPDARKTNSYDDKVRINSMCEDIVARINMDD